MTVEIKDDDTKEEQDDKVTEPENWEKDEEEEGEDAGLEKKEDEKAEEKKEEGEEQEEKEEDELSNEEQLRIEIAELKARNTSLDKTIRNLEAAVNKQGKVLREAEMMEDLDEDQTAKLADAQEARQMFLDGLYETMLINPKYEDMDQVLTDYNKQLVISAFADNLRVEDPTVSQVDAEIAVAQAIEERKNPFKFYYDNIKLLEEQSKAAEGKDEKDKKEGTEKEVKKKDPEMKTSPGSVNDMGGGSNDAGYWTMTRLDNMSEEEMLSTKIPQDVLDKWKEEKLPK